VKALLVLMLSCFVPKLIGRQRHPPARWRGQLADGDCFLWLLKNEYVSLLTLFNPFVIFVSKPRLGSFGFLGKGAVLRIGSFFFYAYGGWDDRCLVGLFDSCRCFIPSQLFDPRCQPRLESINVISSNFHKQLPK
jgi:hypothetical protein